MILAGGHREFNLYRFDKKANFILMHMKFVVNPFSVVCQNKYNVAYGDRAKLLISAVHGLMAE